MRSHVEGEILLMFALSADFPNPLSAKTDSAKTPQCPRIVNMESQLFISEGIKMHHHSRPEHLVCAHPLGPCIALFYPFLH